MVNRCFRYASYNSNNRYSSFCVHLMFISKVFAIAIRALLYHGCLSDAAIFRRERNRFAERNEFGAIWRQIGSAEPVCRAELICSDTGGVEYTVVMEDLQGVIDDQATARKERKRRRPSQPFDIDFEDYHDWDVLNGWLDTIANTCGSRCSLHTAGQSYEGRTMRVLKVTGDGSATRSVFIDSGIHAREWIAPATNVWIANTFVKNYTDSTIKSAVDRFDWYFLLSANPDGYQYTHDVERLWRKTRRPSDFDPSCFGADPNRNFDYEWDRAGSSPDPCSGTYAGDAPFSEPSVQAIRDVINTLSANLTAYVSLHSYSQLWLSPWAYTYDDPADIDEMDRVAEAATDAIFDSDGETYTYGPFSTTLYMGSGVSTDWAYGTHNVVYSYLPELRDTGFWGFLLPPEYIRPTATEILEGILAMAREMRIS